MVSPRETIIRNRLPPALVDDPLFRKALVTTSHMDQTAVCMGKGTALGKRDTTLPHHQTFTRKIIPATDKRLDEVNMARLKSKLEAPSCQKVLPTKAPDYPYSVSLPGSSTRSLVSCARCLCVSTAGLSRDGFTLEGGIGSIKRFLLLETGK